VEVLASPSGVAEAIGLNWARADTGAKTVPLALDKPRQLSAASRNLRTRYQVPVYKLQCSYSTMSRNFPQRGHNTTSTH
jgi:hypothetical protein